MKYNITTKLGTDPFTAVAGSTAPQMPPAATAANTSDKIILPAFLLAFFFGIFGAHRFYVGKIGTAILQLCTCGGFGIWATIDWILILCKAFTDSQGRRITNWLHPDAGAAKPVVQAPGGGIRIVRF
jgi:TM2 domain-containing membrane protein YozV